MTQAIAQPQQRREEWISRVQSLADQIESWSKAQGWTVEREDTVLEEEEFGIYHVPTLHIRLPGERMRELHLTPRGLDVLGGSGRVDLRAYPTLFKVMLLCLPGEWLIMTDSGVPLRLPWDSTTFVQLASDLLS